MEYTTRFEHELAGMQRDDLRKLARAAKVEGVNKLNKDALIAALSQKRTEASGASIAATVAERYPDQFKIDDSTPERHLDTLSAVMGIEPTVTSEAPSEPAPVSEPEAEPVRKRSVAQGRTITLEATSNPKRVGTAAHARFELYADGMTVAEFLKAGGSTADLAWDERHGYIKLSR